MSHNKEDQRQTPAPKVSSGEDLSETDIKGTKKYVSEAEKVAERKERENNNNNSN
ncbi:hypothetical protein [Flavobacterium alkalisoli]|uniref:hypothetical protein n=1 Tax=Flavobacterium alkalisoli TaxID=2602769 RepID=UPI003A8DA119